MKTIGLDGSRAFLKYRTGIEEYSYQVIRHLRDQLPADIQVRLYVRKKLRVRKGKFVFVYPERDFSLPENWELRGIWAPRFWTQIGLSLEMLFRPVDTLFVPAHTLPIIGGRKNVVTVHGLEYEVSPESYGFWERLYMRWSIRYSCWKADTIIAVSENTKKDLMNLYQVVCTKIQVVYEGFVRSEQLAEYVQRDEMTILFIGRIEERKNILRIIRAFELLKEDGRYENLKLILVGKQGHGYDKIKNKIQDSKFKSSIDEKGYVTEEEKRELLQSALVFVFPSLYEGFGLPVLEAQTYGLPAVTSNLSSLPEVGGEAAFYVDPYDVTSIQEGIERVLTMSVTEQVDLREGMQKNLERFSWDKCARKMREILL